ncbi:MAG: hypothetical protein WCF10_18185 [Polyangiales bacterium]
MSDEALMIFVRPSSVAALAVVAIACGSATSSEPSSDALATALSPQQSPEYYVEQAHKYFDTLDTSADPNSAPNYSLLVARWELPPWLLLTGYGRDNMIQTTEIAVALDPSTVPTRDCRAFTVQPFARCYVSFEYQEGSCPIYEEFVFNDEGEMTFIEAWSDQPGLLPTSDPTDRWAEGPDVHRLSTKIPGLGNATGLIDLSSEAMQRAASGDPKVADFVSRAQDFWPAWLQASEDAGPDYFARGCGWSE